MRHVPIRLKCELSGPASHATQLTSRPSSTRCRTAVPGWSVVPFEYRDTVSIPAETQTLPFPARIAWNAIRTVCTDEPQ